MNINDIYFEKNLLEGLDEGTQQEDQFVPKFCKPDEGLSVE